MAAKLSLIFLFLIMTIADGWTQEGPNKPEAKPINLDSKTTAILVLDLNARCENPKRVCSPLMRGGKASGECQGLFRTNYL